MTHEQLLADLLHNMTRTENPFPAPKRIELVSEHYEFLVGIGKDHTARILIDRDAFYELLRRDSSPDGYCDWTQDGDEDSARLRAEALDPVKLSRCPIFAGLMAALGAGHINDDQFLDCCIKLNVMNGGVLSGNVLAA